MNDETNEPLLDSPGKSNLYNKKLIGRDAYIDEDSKKTMAIVNLQAIINVEDVD